MAYSYREVLKEPRALGVFGAALLGRLSFAMGPLSLVLFVRAATGSFAVAGAASAATALTSGLFAPVRGRMVDRYGQPRTLPPLSLLYAAAFVGVLLLASAGRAGEAAAVLLSGVAGAAAPGSRRRSRWTRWSRGSSSRSDHYWPVGSPRPSLLRRRWRPSPRSPWSGRSPSSPAPSRRAGSRRSGRGAPAGPAPCRGAASEPW